MLVQTWALETAKRLRVNYLIRGDAIETVAGILESSLYPLRESTCEAIRQIRKLNTKANELMELLGEESRAQICSEGRS